MDLNVNDQKIHSLMNSFKLENAIKFDNSKSVEMIKYQMNRG